jgi:hypothetical protein
LRSVDGEERIVEGNFPVWSSDGSLIYFRSLDGGDSGADESMSPEDFEIIRQAIEDSRARVGGDPVEPEDEP